MAKGKLTAKEKVQPPIPGVEQEDKIDSIHDAALEYADARDKQVDATKDRNQAAEDLAAAMRKAKKTFYAHGNVTAKLKDSQKVLVKVKSEEEIDIASEPT